MNFALSIIALTLVVALICFYPLLRSVKAKEDKKRDELNKALYFSRLQEIEQDNQQGLVENVEQLKQELQKTLLEDIPQQEIQAIDKNAKNYGKLWFVSGLLGLAIIAGISYFPLGSWKTEDMMEKTLAKLPYFFERIADEDKKKIFDRFYRVDEARTRQKGGFGLGLSLAQQIVLALKGTIIVKDNQPKGTIFEVKITGV